MGVALVTGVPEGGRGTALAADVTDRRQVGDLVDAVTALLDPISVLVVNATGPQPDVFLSDVDWPEHLGHLDFFARSPVLLGHAVLPGMRARGYGRIVHIDSEVADHPPPGRSAYATAEAAQVGLARELAPEGITVNTVAPGFVPVERHADVPEAERAAYLAGVPVGRLGTPGDVAAAVSFFASEDAGFVTGRRLLVDGGRALC
jgi:3-oxoacyl-[acyl-carrier protein] reductase